MKTLLKNCTVILNDNGNVRAESGLNIAVDGEFIGYIGGAFARNRQRTAA